MAGWLDTLRAISGPVHLTIDIDGLDGGIVPATGTPVPGGLSFGKQWKPLMPCFQRQMLRLLVWTSMK